MKLAKNFAAATLLVFVFCLTSFAGDQQTPGSPTPPPPPPNCTATSNTETSEVIYDADGTPVVIEETSEFLYEALLGLLSVY